MSGGQGRAHRFGHIDSNWPEVLLINDYAVFMGYLSMVVTGTGFLVLTWSTVVLLGGFVALLSNKDFWSLTVITLVQTRIFDVFLNGKISHIGYSLKRLCKAARFIALPHNHKKVGFRGAVRVLVFTIVLCPLFLLYMFGLFVSPWISLWRLIQHDYGVTAGDSSSKAHLQPALVVLYSLALFQGVLFYYRAISAWEEHKLVKNVADKYQFDDLSSGSVMDYLHEIKVGCEKDPSFARGRNLITYAVKMMESTSPDGYLSGARILDTLIRFNRDADTLGGEFPGQSMQIYNMIGSASSSPILHNLVQMLDSKSAYDGEIRLPAARIVEHFAGEIHLDKILQGIRCVSSLLEFEQKGFQDDQLSSEEEDDHHSSVKEKDYHPKDCKQMQLTGMQILLKLSYDKNNLFLMSNTDDPTLITKIVAVVTSKGSLHLKEHNEWSRLAELGVKILSRLVMRSMYGPTKSKDILWHEISTSRKAISTLKSILECDKCDSVLKKHAIRILNRICMDTSSVMVEGDTERFVGFLMDIFLHNSKGDFENLAGEDLALKKEELSILKEICMDPSSFMGEVDRENFIGYLMDMFLHNSKGDLFEKLAGDDLVQICRSGSNAAIILKKYGHDIVDCIADTRSGVYSSTHRKIAAKILNHLCSPYSTDEEHLQNLKEAIIDLIPKVLREALGWGLTGKEMERMTVSGLETTQDDDRALQKALASLCWTVYNRIVSKDADLTGRFNNIAAGICDQAAKPRMSFADLIKKAVKVPALAKPKPEPPKPAPCPELYSYPPPYSMYLGEEDPNACCIS